MCTASFTDTKGLHIHEKVEAQVASHREIQSLVSVSPIYTYDHVNATFSIPNKYSDIDLVIHAWMVLNSIAFDLDLKHLNVFLVSMESKKSAWSSADTNINMIISAKTASKQPNLII